MNRITGVTWYQCSTVKVISESYHCESSSIAQTDNTATRGDTAGELAVLPAMIESRWRRVPRYPYKTEGNCLGFCL